MATRYTLFFNQGNRGWSETWYSSTSSPPFGAVSTQLDTVLKKATNMRAANVRLVAVRQTVLTTPRKSVLFNTDGQYLPRTVSGGDLEPEVVSTDAYYQIWSDSFVKRGLFLRGLRETEVKRFNDGTDRLVAALSADVNAYLGAVRSVGWGLLIKSKPPAIGLNWWSVSIMLPDPANAAQTVITPRDAPGAEIVAGTRVRFKGIPFNELLAFPRVTTCVFKTGGGSLVIPYRLRGGASVAPPKMYIARVEESVDPVSTWEFYRFSERKTGRPFGSLVGKKRTLARAV